MNTKWLVPLVLVVTAASISFGVTRYLACRGGDVRIDQLQDVSFLTGALGLSTAQADEIRALHSDLGASLTTCCANHCDARARLAHAIIQNADEATLERCLEELCAAYKASERTTAEHIRQVRAALTPEQRTRFDGMLAGCMCKGCSMDMYAPAPAAEAK